MATPPFPVRIELPGWELYWEHLEVIDGSGSGTEGAARLAALRREVTARARAERRLETLAADSPTVAAFRRLFKEAGCDPSRYRPSSEALLRRVLKGEDLPAIHPLVDLNNCLSVELALPCCMMAEGTMVPPIVLRAGGEGETYDSLRGPLNLAGKPLLADAEGPFGTPITDSQRVKVGEATRAGWLVAYLPAGVVAAATVAATLDRLVAASGALRSR